MSELNKKFPQILLAYVNDTTCELSNNECNELTKYVSGLELELTTAQEENKRLVELLNVCHAYIFGGLREKENKYGLELLGKIQSALNGGKNG
jgi:hypothetical protein